jgi:hypothetical protein
MSDYSICVEYNCELRSKCQRYLSIPLGNYQSYIIGRGNIGKDCTIFLSVEDSDLDVVKDDLLLVDNRNRAIKQNFLGGSD